MRNWKLALAAMLAVTSAAAPASDVTLTGAVYVERQHGGDDGRHSIIASTDSLRPGDRVVYLLSWRNAGGRPMRGGVVTNPLPRAVAFQAAARGSGALVSVDGGRRFGPLDRLRVRDEDGSLRGARPEDVTHVRWALPDTLAPGARGVLSFRAVVR